MDEEDKKQQDEQQGMENQQPKTSDTQDVTLNKGKGKKKKKKTMMDFKALDVSKDLNIDVVTTRSSVLQRVEIESVEYSSSFKISTFKSSDNVIFYERIFGPHYLVKRKDWTTAGVDHLKVENKMDRIFAMLLQKLKGFYWGLENNGSNLGSIIEDNFSAEFKKYTDVQITRYDPTQGVYYNEILLFTDTKCENYALACRDYLNLFMYTPSALGQLVENLFTRYMLKYKVYDIVDYSFKEDTREIHHVDLPYPIIDGEIIKTGFINKIIGGNSLEFKIFLSELSGSSSTPFGQNNLIKIDMTKENRSGKLSVIMDLLDKNTKFESGVEIFNKLEHFISRGYGARLVLDDSSHDSIKNIKATVRDYQIVDVLYTIVLIGNALSRDQTAELADLVNSYMRTTKLTALSINKVMALINKNISQAAQIITLNEFLLPFTKTMKCIFPGFNIMDRTTKCGIEKIDDLITIFGLLGDSQIFNSEYYYLRNNKYSLSLVLTELILNCYQDQMRPFSLTYDDDFYERTVQVSIYGMRSMAMCVGRAGDIEYNDYVKDRAVIKSVSYSFRAITIPMTFLMFVAQLTKGKYDDRLELGDLDDVLKIVDDLVGRFIETNFKFSSSSKVIKDLARHILFEMDLYEIVDFIRSDHVIISTHNLLRRLIDINVYNIFVRTSLDSNVADNEAVTYQGGTLQLFEPRVTNRIDLPLQQYRDDIYVDQAIIKARNSIKCFGKFDIKLVTDKDSYYSYTTPALGEIVEFVTRGKLIAGTFFFNSSILYKCEGSPYAELIRSGTVALDRTLVRPFNKLINDDEVLLYSTTGQPDYYFLSDIGQILDTSGKNVGDWTVSISDEVLARRYLVDGEKHLLLKDKRLSMKDYRSPQPLTKIYSFNDDEHVLGFRVEMDDNPTLLVKRRLITMVATTLSNVVSGNDGSLLTVALELKRINKDKHIFDLKLENLVDFDVPDVQLLIV